MKMTLNFMVMIVTLIMKTMNTTMKMIVDAMEMISEMTGLIKTAKNKSSLIKTLIIVLIMKVIDVMISNTVNAFADMIRMIAKVLNATDMIEIIECMIAIVFAIIIAITEMMKNFSNTISNNSNGTTIKILIGKKLMRIRIAMNMIKITDGCEARLHSSSRFLTDFQTVPLYC